jgi:MFS family permease
MAGREGLWSEPDFLKLWAGQTVSLLGTQVSSLALPLTAIGLLDAGASQLGLLRTAEFLPFTLLTLLAGTWVDRRRRRPLMVTANLLRAALLLAVPLLAWADRLELWHLYGVVTLVGAGAVFFDLSYLSYLPSLVRREQLVEGNSKLAVSASVAEVGGPGLAGLLVQALTAPIAVLVDAASYVASAVSLLTIRAREPEPARVGRLRLHDLRGEIVEGLRVVLANRYLRAIAGEAFTYNLFVQFTETLFLLYATEQLRYQPGAVGLILSGAAVGGLLGSVLAPRVVGRVGFGSVFLWSTALACAAPLLVPLATGPRPLVTTMVGASFFLGGAGVTVAVVASTSLRQSITPDRLLGRMNATMRLASYAAIPLGSLLAGFLGSAIGLRSALLIGAAGFVLPVLFILLSPIPGLSDLREAPEDAPQPPADEAPGQSTSRS